jgi:hypothetical protein
MHGAYNIKCVAVEHVLLACGQYIKLINLNNVLEIVGG